MIFLFGDVIILMLIWALDRSASTRLISLVLMKSKELFLYLLRKSMLYLRELIQLFFGVFRELKLFFLLSLLMLLIHQRELFWLGLLIRMVVL